MAAFTISAISDTGATVYVSPDSTYEWYHVYARLSSDPNGTVYDNWFRLTQGYYCRLSNLSPGTSYTVNVAYGTGASADETVAWIGAQTFTTTGSGGGGGGGGSTTYYVTLSFNANGGSGAPGAVTFTGTSEYVCGTLPSTTPTRSGYTFVGWCFDSDGSSTIYPAGWTDNWWASTSSNYSATMYAVWTKQSAGDGVVRIYTDNGFVSAVPYIWNGMWMKATPYVWNGQWKKGV